jgi:hypothetical protein
VATGFSLQGGCFFTRYRGFCKLLNCDFSRHITVIRDSEMQHAVTAQDPPPTDEWSIVVECLYNLYRRASLQPVISARRSTIPAFLSHQPQGDVMTLSRQSILMLRAVSKWCDCTECETEPRPVCAIADGQQFAQIRWRYDPALLQVRADGHYPMPGLFIALAPSCLSAAWPLHWRPLTALRVVDQCSAKHLSQRVLHASGVQIDAAPAEEAPNEAIVDSCCLLCCRLQQLRDTPSNTCHAQTDGVRTFPCRHTREQAQIRDVILRSCRTCVAACEPLRCPS